jgi:plastocyanin
MVSDWSSVSQKLASSALDPEVSMKRFNLVAVALGAAMLAACGGSSGGSGYSTGPSSNPPTGGTTTGGNTNSNTNQVTMVDQSFSPTVVTVPKGTTVTWTWPVCDNSGSYGYAACITHSVTFDDGSGIASPVQSSGTFSRTFTTAGDFKYHCAVHGTAMNGEVVVQ